MHALRWLVGLGSASLMLACSAASSNDSSVPIDGDEALRHRRDAAPPSDDAGTDATTPPPPVPDPYTLTITSPLAGASVSGTIDVTGVGPGFLNLEVHSASGELLARVTPDGSGNFSAPVDTTRLSKGAQTLEIDAWDSPAGTAYTNHASAALPLEVTNAGASSSCIDSSGHGIRYFGAYTKNTQTNYDVDTWAGFHQDFLTSFINCDTWANAAASDWGFDLMQQQPAGENIQEIVCLSTQEDPSLAHVASGMYDENIKQIAQLFLKHDYPNAIIRVGHEFEGNWYPWGLWGGVNDGDFASFIAAFRRVSSILKSVSPTFTIVWNPGCSYLAESTQSEKGYPGDDVVDVVGVDCYDDGSGVDHLFNGAYGMNQWAQFAKQHGKPIALPEWGLMTGGDNPDYIKAMFDFMVANDTFLEALWDSDDGNTKSQLSSGEAPNAGAMFLQTFGKYAQGCHR
jgi:beta-mannanase